MTGRILAVLAALALLLVLPGLGRTALAQQQPPHRFGGTAALDGKAVAAGVKVSAVIDGKEVATAATTTGGNYIIDVVQPQGASFTGKTVSFTVGGATATPTATWTLGGATVLNLAAVTGGAVPIATALPVSFNTATVLNSMFGFDAQGNLLVYNPARPAALNTLVALTPGDGYIIITNVNVTVIIGRFTYTFTAGVPRLIGFSP
jgi:hypothetical protein